MMSKKEKSQAVENFNVVLNSLVGSHKIDRREAVAMAAQKYPNIHAKYLKATHRGYAAGPVKQVSR